MEKGFKELISTVLCFRTPAKETRQLEAEFRLQI